METELDVHEFKRKTSDNLGLIEFEHDFDPEDGTVNLHFVGMVHIPGGESIEAERIIVLGVHLANHLALHDTSESTTFCDIEHELSRLLDSLD